ncbi:hypothetical protein BKA70DRAFT_1306462, partial [Coprinopsis sp. MPI-PUGE-AT-0042]
MFSIVGTVEVTGRLPPMHLLRTIAEQETTDPMTPSPVLSITGPTHQELKSSPKVLVASQVPRFHISHRASTGQRGQDRTWTWHYLLDAELPSEKTPKVRPKKFQTELRLFPERRWGVQCRILCSGLYILACDQTAGHGRVTSETVSPCRNECSAIKIN